MHQGRAYFKPLADGLYGPVSYTHLDVYKRQTIYSAKGKTDMNEKKTILSGIKPSGELTLGSYIGALKNWVELADQYDCYYMMADMHAITVRQNPAELRRRTLTQLAQYIACGLDPQKNTIFIQSHVPAHAELNWVCLLYTSSYWQNPKKSFWSRRPHVFILQQHIRISKRR